MMMRIPALICLLGGALSAQTVKFVLPPEVLVTDVAVDRRLPPEPVLRATFEQKAGAAFPGRLMHLSANEMISPNELALVLVPTVRAARVSHEVTAGIIDKYEAVIVGDLSLVDPWTNSNLFSGTRMVEASVELGHSQASRRDELLRAAFEAAAARWMDSCLAQLKERATPFVLEGGTLASPNSLMTGGIWPFGKERGVQKGASLRGQGHFAKVVMVAPKYALIQDTAEAGRKLALGERYTLTVVERPTERPEPTVALSWRGEAPAVPPGTPAHTLPSDAFLGLLGNYLSQAGGLRLLPGELLTPEAKAQRQRLHDYIARYSQLAQGNVMTLDQRETSQAALVAPDRKVDLGILGVYHGTRTKSDGSVEHYYRIQLGAAIFLRVGEGNTADYPLQACLEQTEELAQVEQAGVRELDADAAWFTVCRNAVIRLASKVQADLLAIPSGDLEWKEGVADAQGKVHWKGAVPAGFTPLEWFRSAGELKDATGRSLGPLLLPQAPSKGFLNIANLGGERLSSGDILRFSGAPAETPLVPFIPPIVEGPASWLPSPAWLSAMTAQALMGPGACRFLLGDVAPTGRARVVLQISALDSKTSGDTTSYTGQWRVRLQPSSGAEPSAKFGIQNDQSRTLDNPNQTLQPVDKGAWAMDYLHDTLRRLAETATKRSFNQAILASQ